MLRDYLCGWLAQYVLIAIGWSLLQLVRKDKRIATLSSLPLAWGIGVLWLYIWGWFLVRIPQLEHAWHWPIVVSAVILGGLAWVRRSRAPQQPNLGDSFQKLSWVEWGLVVLIVSKFIMIVTVMHTQPVIDSDATNPFRWVGLAKIMGVRGTLPAEIVYTERFFPSLLPAWTAMFLSRWRDNIICLPWLVFYISLAGAFYVGAMKIIKSRTASLMGAYFMASLPLAITHVIRPGYADLLLAAYFLIAMITLTQVYMKRDMKTLDIFILGVAIMGCVLTKMDGALWGLWLLVVGVSGYLRFSREVSWKRILLVQFVGGVILVILYSTAIYFRSELGLRPEDFDLSTRYKLFFESTYNAKAAAAFTRMAFHHGSLNLMPWFGVVGILFLLLRKSTTEAKIMAGYVVVLCAVLFYISCFTVVARYTVQGTNTGRFFLQLVGLFFPVYCFVLRDLFKVGEDLESL